MVRSFRAELKKYLYLCSLPHHRHSILHLVSNQYMFDEFIKISNFMEYKGVHITLFNLIIAIIFRCSACST